MFIRIDRKDLAVYLGFLAITLAFFFRLLDGREVLAFKDLSRYFYPLRFLMVEMVKSGQLPLWNPYIFCGMPFMATLQVGFFYPLTIIHYLLPFDLAFNYYTIIHYYLAAVFMYWLMRHYQLSRPSAFLSGLLFAFSGYMLSVSNMNTTLTSVIWLPLVLLSWDRVLGMRGMEREGEGGGWNGGMEREGEGRGGMEREEEGRGGMERDEEGGGRNNVPHTPSHSLISLIIPLALMFLGGEPTIIYVTGWLMLGYALFLYPDHLKNIGKLALAFVVAALLLSAQLLPFLELLWHSDRGMLSNFQSISNWSFPPREILNFLFPFFFGNPLRAGNYTEILLGKEVQTWLLSPYMGIIPIFLAGLAWLSKEKRNWFLAGAGAVALLLAFGRYTPLYALFFKLIPGISLIRYPVKYLFVVNFALAYLAGAGMDEINKLLENKQAAGMLKYIFGAAAIAGILTLSLNLFRLQVFSWFNYLYPKGLPPLFAEELWYTYNFNIGTALNIFLAFLALWTLTWLALKSRISRQTYLGLLIVWIFIDLLALNSSLLFPAPRSVYQVLPPNLKILTRDPDLFRFYCSLPMEKSARQVSGENYEKALFDNLDRLAANRLLPYRRSDFNGYESIVPKDHRELCQSFSLSQKGDLVGLMSALNIKYALAENPVTTKGFKLLQSARYVSGSSYLYLNTRWRPRAMVVYAAKVIPDRQAILKQLNEAAFDPAETVVLEEKTQEMWRRPSRPANILSYGPNEIIIEAQTEQPGLLFLSDAYYPGWKVWINGKEGKILRANYMFRAVELEKGNNLVRYAYDPISFKLGLILSVLTGLGLAGWGWFCNMKKP